MAPTRPGKTGAKSKRKAGPGRPSSSTNTNPRKSTVAPKKKKTTTPKRLSRTIAKPKASSEEHGQKKPRGRKRAVDNEADEITESQPREEKKKYEQLARKTRRIPQETIDLWPHVSSQVLEQITAVLKVAKNEVANSQRDFRRVSEANDTLNALIRSLTRYLASERVPPHAKDIHFNVDKLNERYRLVSSEVRAARHSNQLLQEQVRVAQHYLKKDEENLEQLKKNAKKWKGEWKHQEKQGQLHPLLQGPDEADDEGDMPDDIGLKQSKTAGGLWEASDAELAPLLEQLRRSLESMQGNHAQVEGMAEAARNARAGLDDVLFKHASAQQYDGL